MHKLTPLAAAAALAASGAAASQSPVMTKQDQEWITVTGPISQITSERFVIDYGEGQIPIEWDGAGASSTSMFQAGDWVTVSGRIDDALWERRTIEGSTLYHSRLPERFWSNANDEEGDYALISGLSPVPTEGEWVRVTGDVTRVDALENEVHVDTGMVTVQVDTDRLSNLDFADPGDRVSVTGRLDDADLWDAREIDATSLTILEQG
ncbi:hypothetical protein Q0812_02825 [Brevundimonas sp. 2R-24]|uniref:DUF5666 domain-containing protein n=1 Tax=Peiella sedimenti TaxID=3061083 RepID=A0ABT8SIG2_9CAUL|nr:hypothetical protein [Caulobacteraceae bacterium XZ-24]